MHPAQTLFTPFLRPVLILVLLVQGFVFAMQFRGGKKLEQYFLVCLIGMPVLSLLIHLLVNEFGGQVYLNELFKPEGMVLQRIYSSFWSGWAVSLVAFILYGVDSTKVKKKNQVLAKLPILGLLLGLTFFYKSPLIFLFLISIFFSLYLLFMKRGEHRLALRSMTIFSSLELANLYLHYIGFSYFAAVLQILSFLFLFQTINYFLVKGHVARKIKSF